MGEELLDLPVGIQSFELLRNLGKLYVDKTPRLMKLIKESTRVFLSRPRRFGKSLTLSTLDAMFSGKVELFHGLAAEVWAAEQAKHPCPVLRLDMSAMDVRDVPHFEDNLVQALVWRAEDRRQVEEKGYAKPYDAENRAVTIGVVVVDARRRQAIPPDGGSQPPSDR